MTSKTSPKRRRIGATAKPKHSYAERDDKQLLLLLTPDECADLLAVTERQVRRLIQEGKLRKSKVKKLVRIHPDDLNAYIDSCRVPAEGQ